MLFVRNSGRGKDRQVGSEEVVTLLQEGKVVTPGCYGAGREQGSDSGYTLRTELTGHTDEV